MSDNIIDSSAWIEYFRGNEEYSFIEDLIYNNLVCTNDIILVELLPSIIHRGEKKLAELLYNLRKTVLLIDWQDIQNMQILNLKYGNNHVGISDIIIAQNCMQDNLMLITRDKHFKTMAKYMPLKIYP
ncbi:MAG: PIN domain-containing protein [Spirochaetaceae bacterium]|jgi:predicted nucleic acid-binding protein|nr:PIN domain-containing protein [Spirochaetaceae bacterium]